MDIRKRLAYNLRRLRQEKGLSQEQFAFDVDIHRTYISDLERGARNPTILIIEKLALFLCVDEGELFDAPDE
ncbi:helix-turn-helix domain-containing protein [Ascidiaceihabitans sp.]|nr:helix-turn-helix domain-containing protein [Ascidiaceihabitans sp.]